MSESLDELAAAALTFARAIIDSQARVSQNVSLSEAARRLGVSRSMLYILRQRGDIKEVRIGSRRLIPESEIDRYLTARRSG